MTHDDDRTRSGLRPAAVRVAPDARLHLVFPPALGGSLPLGAESVIIGRSAGPGVRVVADGTVSRKHGRVEWHGERHVLTDLDSHNGSRVQGRRLAPSAALADGAVVRLGDSLMVYERGGVGDGEPPTAELPGRGHALARLRWQVARAAPDPAPALITGETGTGKEYLARALHAASGRPGPFVAINCAALSPQLVESQLFGHVRGAFTGAREAAPGLFRQAAGGTLLLDEIGDLPPAIQPKLLRVIQERAVLPVGGGRALPVDVRIVAATLHPLGERVEAGCFRRDLFARLALWTFELPPLRARPWDVLDWFARLRRAWHAARPHIGDGGQPLDVDAAERLLLDPWPENLRGLGRVVHRLAAEGGPITGARVDALIGPAPRVHGPQIATGPRPPKPSARELQAALESLGSVAAVARAWQRDRRQIYRWLDAYGLRQED